MLILDAKRDTFVFSDESGRTLCRGRLFVEDDDGRRLVRLDKEGGGRAASWALKVDVSRGAEGLSLLTVRIAPAPNRRLVRLFLRIRGGEDAMPPLDSPETRMLAFRRGPSPHDGVIRLGKDRPVECGLATVLCRPGSKRSFLFGAGGLAEDFSEFSTDNRTLQAGFVPNRTLLKEETYCLACAAGPDPLDLLDRYGRYLARFARPASEPLTGWNSWDYYAGAITMAGVRGEMAAINRSPLRGKIRHVVLDMGWEQAWGEWTPNRRFPGRFRAIAKEIEEAGFVPGIWIAPLQAHSHSVLGRHRQDLFLRDENGNVINMQRSVIFDFTLPEVHEILSRWLASMRQAGFRVFKVDYIYQPYLDVMNHYCDKRRGKAGVIRKGLEIMREAIGDDGRLLNCGGPAESALGLADSSRVTGDIHTFWGHVKHNARQMSVRLWQNHRLWTIDPDFAVIRCAETTSDPFPNGPYARRPLVEGQSHWMAGPEATYGELRVWLTQVYLSAGNTFVSDSIGRLNAKGLDTLAQLFPPLEQSARPLDLFLNPIPRFWLARSGRRHWLGIFNWEDRQAPILIPKGVDLPPHGVDKWTGQRVEIAESTRMAARSAYLLQV